MSSSTQPAEVVLAIVGSVKFTNPNAYAEALEIIVETIRELRPTRIVSGEADGMDTFGETIARLQGIPFTGYPPKNARWEPEGYKERNMQIADACTHLLAIRCREAKTYGSGWTADYAEQTGKHVRRHKI